MLRLAGSLLLLSVALSAPLSAEIDWRFAHPGADMLVGFNLRNLANSPMGGSFREALTSLGGIGRDRLGMLEEIDEVYVSLRTRYVKGRPSGEPLSVVLVRGNFDSGAIMKLFQKQPKLSVRFIDRRTILLGDEESMASAVERLKGDDGLVSPVVTRAQELAANNDVWMVGSPAPMNGVKPRGSFKRQGGMLGDLEEVFDNLRSFSLGLAFRDEIKLDLGLNMRTKAGADRLMSLYQRFEADMQKTPEGQKRWAEMSQALEVHPNGTAVRFYMHSGMANLQAALAQATGNLSAGGLMPPPPVQIAEHRPAVSSPMPVVVVAPPAPPRRTTVRVYGMETGYREIPTTPR